MTQAMTTPGDAGPAGPAAPTAPTTPSTPTTPTATPTGLDAAVARLQALVDWERRARHSMVVDLLPVGDLLRRLGDPHRGLRCVHVAGTKGKGSVCALIEAGLHHAGLSAGRYGSPHLERLNERISLHGQAIGDQALGRALHTVLDQRDAARGDGGAAGRATWFDVVTAAAFKALCDAGVSWAVIEVGMGGRLDSTNVVQPEVAVITNLALEHTDVLGGTIEAIAAHKAGILKPGCELVTPLDDSSAGAQQVWAIAAALTVPVHRVVLPPGSTITAGNRAVARAVLDVLGARGHRSNQRNAALNNPLSAADLPDAVAEAAALPGRLEVGVLPLPGGGAWPAVIDGAHTAESVRAVLDELQVQAPYAQPPTAWLALAADKNAEAIVQALAGRAAQVLCLPLDGPHPGIDPEVLQTLCRARAIPAQAVASIPQALDLAAGAAAGSWLLVLGSLRLAATVRRRLVPRDASAQDASA
jgi:dihydrofolate synthase / folylpolyglutamate synthase